jgi:poly(3-hydroxybutyrate) depolymerase
LRSSIFFLVTVVTLLAGACARKTPPAPPAAPDAAASPAAELDAKRAAALEALGRARAATLSDVSRAISLPSIERLVEDAEARRTRVTDPARDLEFVRRSLDTARGYADVLANGEDPYDYARGPMVKAYRAEWDGALQPYALYVPKDYDAARPWPLVVALHGAGSSHRHMLRRVFGLDNRPGESDEEASRNELPLPEVPALVVAPYGRGELMGYDGLGGQDVLRVLADVRRAYNVDPDRVTLTGLSMGGGGTWALGLQHPELFAGLAPICGVTDSRRLIPAADRGDYDLAALEALEPPAFAENAAGLRVLIFHGDADPTVPVADSRRMVERFRKLGWLGKTVTYTEYAGVDHKAWIPAYADAKLLRALAELKRSAKERVPAKKKAPADHALPGLFGKSWPRQRPHLYVYGTHGGPGPAAQARNVAQALADWGPGVGARFTIKRDDEVTVEDKARFELVLVGAAPLNALAPADKPAPGEAAFRLVTKRPDDPARRMLVFGATTPAGFTKLRRFAGPNAERKAPEPNRDWLSF